MNGKLTCADASPMREAAVGDFLKRLPAIRSKKTPPAKPWDAAFGTMPDDKICAEAATLGLEWRKAMNKTSHG